MGSRVGSAGSEYINAVGDLENQDHVDKGDQRPIERKSLIPGAFSPSISIKK
jgi:hypothetical protein